MMAEQDELELDTQEPEELKLWPWQEEAVEELRANIRKGVANQVLAAPTGSGKTIIATYLIQRALELGKRCIFVCDRIPLIDQTSAVFDTYGIDHGVIQADHWRLQPWRRAQVASVQTLDRRSWPEELDLIVVDECHTVYQSVVDRITDRETTTIGLTATPFTKGLGKLYDEVVTVRTLTQLTDDGYLAPFDVYSASEPEMDGAKVNAGEWSIQEASERAMPIVGDVVAEYLKHAAGKKFICFGSDVRHCEELQRQFQSAGVQCGLYTYKTTTEEREEMVEEFRKRDGYLSGLISVAALAKGFDVPSVEAIIMCRPLRSSLAEHIQILGRGLRKDPENPEKRCIVLDHAGNMRRFWGPMWDFFNDGIHELDDGKRRVRKKKDPKDPEPMKCPTCAHIHFPRKVCPMCGYEYPPPEVVRHLPGELVALASVEPEGMGTLKQDVYSQLVYVAERRGYKPGYAAYKFKELFNHWPDGLAATPKRATPKTWGFIVKQTRAYKQSMEAAG